MKERKTDKKEALENESMQEEKSLENAGRISKKHVQGIIKVMDDSMKFHRCKKEDFKELIWRKKKIVCAKNHEDAEGHTLATRGTLSKFVTIEEAWKQIITALDVNENEIGRMKKHHEKQVKWAKTMWEKMKEVQCNRNDSLHLLIY